MNTLRTLGLASLFVASWTLVACNEDKGLASKSPEERVDAVKSALQDPSGEVNADTAKIALDVSLQQAKFEALGDFLQGIPGLYGEGSGACTTGSNTDGQVDVSCSSDGKTKGSVSFKVDTSASGSGSSTLVEMTFEDVCQGDVCADGSMIVSVEASATGATTTMQASLDMTSGGETSHSDWGLQVSAGAAGTSVDLAVFDEAGDSYVLSTAVSADDASGNVTIKGANGEFSCSFDGGGASGSCTGSGEFSW